MAVQTTYSTQAALGIAGMLADSGPSDIASAAAQGTLVAGIAALKGSAERTCKPILSTNAPTADVDAIVATLASTAGVQTLTGAALDGVVGGAEMIPPRNVTMTFSSHADWDATTATVTGTDENGETVTENFSIPNGGNATVTGTTKFRTVTSIAIPAQSGTGGTATIGTGSLLGNVDRHLLGISLYDATREPGAWVDNDTVPVLRQGRAWVTSETAVNDGDPVFVRFVVSGDEVYGALRATPDSNDCVRWTRARWRSMTAAAGLAIVELNLP